MKTILSAAIGTVLVLLAVEAGAQGKAAERKVELLIERQSLADALNDWAKQTGLQLVSPSSEMMNAKLAPRIKGTYSPQAALEELLKGTSLTYDWVSERAVAIRDKSSVVPAALQTSKEGTQSPFLVTKFGGDAPQELRLAASDSVTPQNTARASSARTSGNAETNAKEMEELIVTGTHIKGVVPAGSPVLVLDEPAIRRSGYTSTEQLIQSIPQNVRSGAEGATPDPSGFIAGSQAGFNSTRGSGANLRGLGATATLTLINGRRIAASGFGTFTDISLIPIDAIERIEVLMDGASAIYGADAVAGVINIILKRDYDGAETRVRYGATEPSGRNEVRASQTLGSRWSGGSGMAVVDYLKQTELSVDERDFTSNIASPTSIYPENKHVGIVLSGTQQFGERWLAQADVQLARVKRFARSVSNNPVGVVYAPIDIDRSNAGLGLVYRAFGDWDISLDGVVSKEDGDFDRRVLPTGVTVIDPSSQFHHLVEKQWNVGLKATGSSFELPAGRVGLALGASHRVENFLHRSRDVLNTPFNSQNRVAERDVNSAFAEVHVPLFGASNSRRGLQRLEVSLAGRYDDYSDFGGTVNPKIGVSWLPFSSLELRSSYSTSFRAPATGNELVTSFSGINPNVLIVSFASADGSGTVPVAFIQGANVLKAEEARNWTAGFTFKPATLAGLQIGLTYYDISYTDRIVVPPFDQGAFSNPGLQSFLTTYSSSTQLQDALAALGATTYLDITGPDFSGGEFGPNPQTVTTALYDSRYTNAGSVKTSGLDLVLDYSAEWMSGIANLGLNVNRITDIDTTFAPGAPTLHLVGTTGNPARLRFRTTAAYMRGGWDSGLAVNYTGKYTDTSGAVDADTSAYVTVDGYLRYVVKSAASGASDNLSFSLSVTNLFNESPPFVQASGAAPAHYDPANADPLGRLIAIEVAKRW